ncbi:hypothetical protein Ndes2526A_g01027 [Nannochloris sp. 'desiccata']
MPPKAKAGAKVKDPAKSKTIEDKTFGLKNKNKSKKVQQYVNQLNASANPSHKQKRLEEPTRKDKKKAEEEAAKELAALFALTIKQPKVPPGVDPKSIVCEYFRAGQCTKGFKCKFSHDLNVERKGPKLDIYADKRDDEDEGMEDWTQEDLEKAIAQKHSADNKNRATDIVCRFFIDAVEKRQYGWFWQCPNGKDCKYRHALPPGYVLKSQMKALLDEEAANSKSVEETIEEERAKVDAKTLITEEVFQKWKSEWDAKVKAAADQKLEERRRKGVLTGREIFSEEGFVAQDDASASDAYTREVDEEAAIKRMHEEAKAAMEQAKVPALSEAGGETETAAAAAEVAPASTAAAAKLTEQEEEELFGDDDDDDDDGLLDELASDLTGLKT